MRITNNQLYENLMSGINKQLKIKNDGNASIASGTRFQRPAQAGLDYKTSLDLRHTQSQIQGSLEALTIANSRLSASQTMLHDISNVLTRAQTIAVQQASGQIGAQEHVSAAAEVQHLLNQAVNSANQKWQGEALFSGTAVNQQAFVQDAFGIYQYQGSNQDRIVSVSTSQNITSNVRGDEPAFIKTLTALSNFQNALTNNDQAGIATAISELTDANNSMIDLTSRVGGQISAIQSYTQSYEDMKFAIDKRMNEHEAADIPALVASMQQADLALQASYSQIANIKNLSLVNFLR
jgi:flagellin-like hook-associated protein FlgL